MDAVNALPHPLRGGYIFANPDSGEPWSQAFINREWRRICQELEIEGKDGERPDLYSCRHTCATRLGIAKQPIQRLAKILGHSNYKELETYLHADDSDITEAGEALAEIVASERKGPGRIMSVTDGARPDSKKS
jgi:integrase